MYRHATQCSSCMEISFEHFVLMECKLDHFVLAKVRTLLTEQMCSRNS